MTRTPRAASLAMTARGCPQPPAEFTGLVLRRRRSLFFGRRESRKQLIDRRLDTVVDRIPSGDLRAAFGCGLLVAETHDHGERALRARGGRYRIQRDENVGRTGELMLADGERDSTAKAPPVPAKSLTWIAIAPVA